MVNIKESEVLWECELSELMRLHNYAAHIVDEVLIVAEEGRGVSFKAVDPAHVAMVGAHFDWPVKKSAQFLLDCDALKVVAKMWPERQVRVKVALCQRGSTRPHFVIAKEGEWEYPIKTEDQSNHYGPKVPKLTLSAVAAVKAGRLADAVNLVQHKSDHVELFAKGDKCTLAADSDEGGRAEYDLKADVAGLPEGKEQLALYSVDYFGNMARSIKPETDVRLEFGTDFPIRMVFEEHTTSGKATVTYLLAPRISSE